MLTPVELEMLETLEKVRDHLTRRHVGLGDYQRLMSEILETIAHAKARADGRTENKRYKAYLRAAETRERKEAENRNVGLASQKGSPAARHGSEGTE